MRAGMNCAEGVAQLVPGLRLERPFLCEGVGPILAVPQALKRLNVLHDAEFLVVGLLHQEAVVLNAGDVFGGALLGALRGIRRRYGGLAATALERGITSRFA